MDTFGLELELDRIEARIAAEVDAASLGLWREQGRDPAAGLAASPSLLDDGVRRTLAEARRLAPDAGERATRLWRLATEARFAAADAARATPVGERTEAGLIAARDARHAAARALGFDDAWALARAIAGEEDEPLEDAPPADDAAAVDHPAFARALAEPRATIDAAARWANVTADPISVEVVTADAPVAGRTYVVAPGADVRIRVWRRPTATDRGTVRVLLHELGHALLAASWPALPWSLRAPPSRAFDEASAAWCASFLEDERFLAELLGIAGGAAIAAAERAAHARRRARLTAAARAERAFLRDDGPAPWRDALAWTDPGAAFSYAAAEQLLPMFAR